MKKSVVLMLVLTIVTPLLAQNWDVNTLQHINGWGGNFIHDYSSFISKSEPYIAMGVPLAMGLTGWLKNDEGLMKDAMVVGMSVASAYVFAYGMKLVFDRPRPYEAYPDLIYPRSYEDSSSFPSGHTASAFALATSLCIRYPKWYVIAPSALWAGSVAFSRMHEGVHYPTDVMAGAALGIGLTIGSHYLSKWLNKKLF